MKEWWDKFYQWTVTEGKGVQITLVIFALSALYWTVRGCSTSATPFG